MRTPVIAHILPWANIAGTEIATLRLAEVSREAGYANVIYVPSGPGTDTFEAFASSYGFPIIRYAQVPPERRRPWRYGANVLSLAASFARRRVDLVHCSDVTAAYFSALAGRLAGARVVSHVRCDQPEQSRQERWLLKPVQRYVFVSRNTMDAGTIAHQPDQAEVLYDGVPLPRPDLDRAAARAHYGLPHDAFVVGMAARFHVQKDHETLVRAVQMLAARSPHLRVLLVGNHDAPSARDYVAQLEAALHLTGTRHLVTFAGLEMNMERFYAAIDVKVLSTHFEGLPLVLMEAMAAGRPVVATAVSGIPEVVEHGTTGFLVPRLQPQPLADALFTLADDPATAVRMGRAGRARVEALFSDTAYQRNVAALYGRLLGPPLKRPSVPAPGPVRPCGQTEAVTDQAS